MRRLILSATAAMIVLAAALPARGGDAPYSPDWAVALKGGAWQTDVQGADAAPAYGIEISVTDPLIEPVAGQIRHMVSLNHADHDQLRLTTLEWNAHWVFETQRNLWIGAGPGIGYLWADGRNVEDSPAVQLGASVTYMEGHMLLGVESRYQWTEAKAADNWLTMVKVGWKF